MFRSYYSSSFLWQNLVSTIIILQFDIYVFYVWTGVPNLFALGAAKFNEGASEATIFKRQGKNI